MTDQKSLLGSIMEAEYSWFISHVILNWQAKLAWCFHLAEKHNVWIEFRKFNPPSGVIRAFAELPREIHFDDLEELEAILVIWDR